MITPFQGLSHDRDDDLEAAPHVFLAQARAFMHKTL